MIFRIIISSFDICEIGVLEVEEREIEVEKNV